eukprot:Hpha_TRINITY_DN30573_c0_g1::TRINITY_DN30573_c0_g1_i1::g.193591::m.193591
MGVPRAALRQGGDGVPAEMRARFEAELLEMNALRLQWASERADMVQESRVLRESIAQARRDLAEVAFPPRRQLSNDLPPDPRDEEARVDALVGRRAALVLEITELEDRLGELQAEAVMPPPSRRNTASQKLRPRGRRKNRTAAVAAAAAAAARGPQREIYAEGWSEEEWTVGGGGG